MLVMEIFLAYGLRFNDTRLILGLNPTLLSTIIRSASIRVPFQTFFLKMGQPGLFFAYFRLFIQNIEVASRIRTQIVGVEGKNADH